MNRLRRFLFPALTRTFMIRAGLIALFTYLIFGYLLIPFRIEGYSMEPTYRNGAINFCWRGRYLFSKPKRGDVVVIRLAGQRVTLLKRVVGLEGEVVEFKNGKLLVDGIEIEEPYLRIPSRWTLPPRRVEPGSVYVVGDNRGGPMRDHLFGQVSLSRILGSPLW
ncbi:MAG: signal peptidase I [Desulfobacterota bacterium]|nr:signal peptidase I [Thermodesulfobacteriota bacterium]